MRLLKVSENMRAIRTRLGKALVSGFSKRLAERVEAHPLISFTFDDFPKSAWMVGGKMLTARKKKGTYYACMGLMGSTSEVGSLFTLEDVQQLCSAGHELGCHTLDHVSCHDVTAREFAENCENNRQMAASVLGGYSLRNLSFPFGHASFGAKRILRSRYDTCRSTESGTNIDPVDLSFLRATPMYSRFDIDTVKRLISENTKAKSWLILYTHDVTENPSPYGCTPDYFEEILDCALGSGADIVTVAEAVTRFRGSA